MKFYKKTFQKFPFAMSCVMARVNPCLRSLRIFDPDVDLAIDEEPISGKGKKTTIAYEDFMADFFLSPAGKSASSEDSAESTGAAGPGKIRGIFSEICFSFRGSPAGRGRAEVRAICAGRCEF
jgi:hypothetical protein